MPGIAANADKCVNSYPCSDAHEYASREAEKRLCKLVQRYCTNIEIKLALSSFKVGSMFSVKDPVPLDLLSRDVIAVSFL